MISFFKGEKGRQGTAGEPGKDGEPVSHKMS